MKYPQWVKKQPFHVGVYDEMSDTTQVTCKTCGELKVLNHELSERAHGEDSEMFLKATKAANQMFGRDHKCPGPPPPNVYKGFLPSKTPMREWTREGLMQYLHEFPESAPKLIRITKIVFPITDQEGRENKQIKHYMCILEHPESGLYNVKNPLRLNEICMNMIPSYREAKLKFQQQEADRAAKDEAVAFTRRIIEDVIDTVEFDYMWPPKVKNHEIHTPAEPVLYDHMGKSKSKDALYTYRSLIMLFKSRIIQLTPSHLDDLLCATFYGAPEIKQELLGRWTGEEFTAQQDVTQLLYKPCALQNWLYLAKHKGTSEVHLVVDTECHDGADPNGFTGRSLPLRFNISGMTGVLCAVLCDGRDPTEVHDARLVLPLTILGTATIKNPNGLNLSRKSCAPRSSNNEARLAINHIPFMRPARQCPATSKRKFPDCAGISTEGYNADDPTSDDEVWRSNA